MPAKSEQQRKLFGTALAMKRGEQEITETPAGNIARTVPEKKIEEYAKGGKSVAKDSIQISKGGTSFSETERMNKELVKLQKQGFHPDFKANFQKQEIVISIPRSESGRYFGTEIVEKPTKERRSLRIFREVGTKIKGLRARLPKPHFPGMKSHKIGMVYSTPVGGRMVLSRKPLKSRRR